MTIEKWLESCPAAVIARVITDVEDIRSLAISSELYPSDTLVLVSVESLSTLHKRMSDKLSSYRTNLLSDALDLIEEQCLHIESPLLPEGEALISAIRKEINKNAK
ncbi:MAG: hypothetical protein Tp178MES00d2C33159851_26 [Prokaryotic dsDNA virus sp.]|nr:MAG: hypothetical protein Tp178MES00d2C33159851_26 [Prokaryotic dsDNA virus sp.]|tara:strand:+ start:81473 stop:81790 length:318 start_codon:yes stop_codon:yes gene_type:complete